MRGKLSGIDGHGYDVIGDIHGCANELEALLELMGYEQDRTECAYRQAPDRRAIFVGDLIDRGPDQLRVLQTVKAMVDAGSAHVVLGNHEFNALALRHGCRRSVRQAPAPAR